MAGRLAGVELRRGGGDAALAGGEALLAVATAGRRGGPRAWQAWHVNFMFWTGLAQGLVVFAATQKLAKGHWSGGVIRTSAPWRASASRRRPPVPEIGRAHV